MKNLELTNKTEIIKDLEINFLTETIKSSLSTLNSKIKRLFKTTSRPNGLNTLKYDAYMQHQDSRANSSASSYLDGGFNMMNFSRFDECLNNMPTMQRKAFHLKTFGNNSTTLICKELNIDEVVFWDLINKSRKELVVALSIQ